MPVRWANGPLLTVPAADRRNVLMQFVGGDGKIFRNWDLAENYRIGPDVPQFNRSANVLRP